MLLFLPILPGLLLISIPLVLYSTLFWSKGPLHIFGLPVLRSIAPLFCTTEILPVLCHECLSLFQVLSWLFAQLPFTMLLSQLLPCSSWNFFSHNNSWFPRNNAFSFALTTGMQNKVDFVSYFPSRMFFSSQYSLSISFLLLVCFPNGFLNSNPAF